jgi:hypothetical protein
VVSEASVHGLLAPLLWAWLEAEMLWWKVWCGGAENSPHVGWEAERKRGGSEDKTHFKGTPSVTYFLHQAPPSFFYMAYDSFF